MQEYSHFFSKSKGEKSVAKSYYASLRVGNVVSRMGIKNRVVVAGQLSTRRSGTALVHAMHTHDNGTGKRRRDGGGLKAESITTRRQANSPTFIGYGRNFGSDNP